MKKENVFETDAPTIEMETQTFRRTQNGQSTPMTNGTTFNGYNGYNGQSSNANFQQPTAFTPSNGTIIPQGIQQPGYYQTQPFQPISGPWGPVAYPAYQQPFGYQQPFSYQQPAAYFPTPQPGFYPVNTPSYIPTTQATWNSIPATPFNQIPYNTFQPVTGGISTNGITNAISNGYQPAINLADGQYTMVPQTNFQNSFSKNGTPFANHGTRDFISWIPTVNILETDRAYKIEVCVPGVSRENCRVHIDKNNVLRVTGTRRWNQETDAVGFTKKEFNYGSFACSFIIADNMQREKISSSCRNGVLIISIPKKEWNEVDTQNSSEISIN
ncbi:MAG: hypothetical protein RL213_490 [Bacteroidota bacterium]|jgi:HSP20 family protein